MACKTKCKLNTVEKIKAVIYNKCSIMFNKESEELVLPKEVTK